MYKLMNTTEQDGQIPKEIFKYETHMHTCETSACAVDSGANMANAYHKAGYQGIIVTDHFFNGNTCVPTRGSWERRIELFCKGFDHAKEQGDKIGLQVFFGWEYGYDHTDWLTYGLDREFLLENPDILSWDIEKYARIVHENGGFITHAHPFREAFYISKMRLFPDLVDGVEVINASHKNPDYNKKALEFAQKHNLCQLSGSDAHAVSPILGGGIGLYHKAQSLHDLLDTVRSGKGYCLLGQ